MSLEKTDLTNTAGRAVAFNATDHSSAKWKETRYIAQDDILPGQREDAEDATWWTMEALHPTKLVRIQHRPFKSNDPKIELMLAGEWGLWERAGGGFHTFPQGFIAECVLTIRPTDPEDIPDDE